MPAVGPLRSVARRGRAAASALAERLRVTERLLERELVTGASVSVPLARRLRLYRHGFTSRGGVLFDVDLDRADEYLSEYDLERLDDLGGSWADAVGNKLVATLLLDRFADRLPACYGVLDGGRLRRGPLGDLAATPLDTDAPTDAVAWLDAYLHEHDRVVLKPVYGYAGKGVLVCARDDDGYTVNGERYDETGFAALVADLEEYLAWQFVDQADYAAGLYPDATNTLRVLTLWDDEADEPFVAGAVHRVGTDRSAPVDNWSRGGLSALVRDDGTLSEAAAWDDDAGAVRWHETHPDTGGQLVGTTVPEWPAVREQVLAMAATVPSLPRVGWDVVVTDGGMALLELNTHPGVETLQVHGPHLRDPRVRRFHERHG